MQSQNMIDNTEKDPSNWRTGHQPMTGAQKSYIETLSRGDIKVPRNISKADASRLIEKLQNHTGIK